MNVCLWRGEGGFLLAACKGSAGASVSAKGAAELLASPQPLSIASRIGDFGGYGEGRIRAAVPIDEASASRRYADAAVTVSC